MLWDLSVNDFKARFASSFLGAVWAYITPLVTMLVFWFVFQVGLRTADISNVAFIVWFAPAFLAWTFFSETLSMGTVALREYSYLVRKVKFRVSVIPLVKIISGCFVHAAFIVFMILLVACYQIPLTIYSIQLLYYFLCTVLLLTGLCWLFSAITPFFPDMQSIVAVLIQIGFWTTPIIWNADAISSNLVHLILKLNPMYYICRGYRDALIEHIWFWQRGYTNLLFWVVTLAFFMLGALVFRKLRPHFADVL
jgi:ABC-type polysaccharide/polyol phosphate export permease